MSIPAGIAALEASAAYATLGGINFYLKRLSRDPSLMNRHIIFLLIY